MDALLIVVHVLVSVALIGLILLQHGKGADAGASFGAGASQTLFGAGGSATVLSRATKWLAIVFFSTSLGLAYLARLNVEAQNSALVPGAPVTGKATGDVPPAPAGTSTPESSGDVPAAPAPAGN